MSHEPFFEYEVPFVTSAHWYLTHGRSVEWVQARLEMLFPFASRERREAAIGWALRSRGFDLRAQQLRPFERLSTVFFESGLSVPIVGLRVLIKIQAAPGVIEDASVTVNVPSDWTANQMLDEVDEYIRQDRLGSRTGRHYPGEVVGYQLYGITGLAFNNPSLDLSGFEI